MNLPNFDEQIIGNLTFGQIVIVTVLALAVLGVFSLFGIILRLPRLIFGPGCGCIFFIAALVAGFLIISRPS